VPWVIDRGVPTVWTPPPYIDAHRQDGALLRRLRADPADMLVDQILE